MRVIRRFARDVAEKFHPDKIILFGSYAYGTPHEDSDVDILVIMPTWNQLSTAARIHIVIDPPFPLDIIVRTPKNMSWRWKTATYSTRKSCRKERSCMKRTTREWVRKAERDYRAAKKLARGKEPFHDQLCFHCQQAAEKYLKALLEELAQPVPRIHLLYELLDLLLPAHPSLRPLRRGLIFLTRFAVDTRYPGDDASKRQAEAALRWADKVRTAARTILKLPLRPPRRQK